MEREFLVAKLRHRDREAVKLVYELFSQDIFRVVYGLSRNYQLAEDACHEAFARLLERIDELRDVTKLRSWLIRVALNEAWSRLRELKRLSLTDTSFFASSLPTNGDPQQTLVENEENQIIWNLVERLPLQHRSIVVMHYTLGMGIEEIGGILEIPAGTVKSRLGRALQTLRRRWSAIRGFQGAAQDVPGVKAK